MHIQLMTGLIVGAAIGFDVAVILRAVAAKRATQNPVTVGQRPERPEAQFRFRSARPYIQIDSTKLHILN
jgi:hypothetical protein